MACQPAFAGSNEAVTRIFAPVGRHRYVSAKNTYGLELTFDATIKAMGYNARNDEIHENLERMRREHEAYEDSLAVVRQFNAATIREEDRLVLADDRQRARLEASLAHHRV